MTFQPTCSPYRLLAVRLIALVLMTSQPTLSSSRPLRNRWWLIVIHTDVHLLIARYSIVNFQPLLTSSHVQDTQSPLDKWPLRARLCARQPRDFPGVNVLYRRYNSPSDETLNLSPPCIRIQKDHVCILKILKSMCRIRWIMKTLK